jgi:hypothetical protein
VSEGRTLFSRISEGFSWSLEAFWMSRIKVILHFLIMKRIIFATVIFSFLDLSLDLDLVIRMLSMWLLGGELNIILTQV